MSQELIKKIEKSVKFIQRLSNKPINTAVVLGSGLGPFVDSLENKITCPYSEIPFFESTKVQSHKGMLVIGEIQGVTLLVLQGRIHLYEGYSAEKVVYPIRTISKLGIKNLVLTNVAGGINSTFSPGDFVVIKDQINLTGHNPLIGKESLILGPRFPDMSKAYDPLLIKKLFEISKKNKIRLKEGIYAGVLGPSYETPAEIRMLKVLGADMVGMSTVCETIAAKQIGIKVCGISTISNMGAGLGKKILRHEEITKEAKKVITPFSNLLKEFIIKIN